MRNRVRKEPKMNVLNIDEHEDVRAARRQLDEIVAREQRLKEYLLRLQNGPTPDEKQAQVNAVLAGEEVPNNADTKADASAAYRELAVVLDAKHVAEGELYAARKSAERKTCELLRPRCDELHAEICKNFYDMVPLLNELYAIKRGLASQGAGYYGLFNVDPFELLGAPNDRSSDFADFMREAAKAGYCKELPR
jgi:hypothetical protein